MISKNMDTAAQPELLKVQIVEHYGQLVAPRKILAVFDFDYTLVEANSVSIIEQLIPNHLKPISTRELYRSEGSFLPYTNLYYKKLHELNVTPEQIVAQIGKVPAIQDMDKLVRYLNHNNCEIIIISNSYTIFVSQWLRSKSLLNAVTNIYTNPSRFNEMGMLTIKPYHNQSMCRISPRNLCKRWVLSTFLQKKKHRGIHYDSILYIGDGKNDVCAVKLLNESDFVFARVGYELLSQLQKQFITNANIYSWVKGSDIIQVVADNLKLNGSESEKTFTGTLNKNISNYFISGLINLENCMTRSIVHR